MADIVSSDLQPFHAMEIFKRANALELSGRNIIHLEVGEPAAAPAPAVRDAVRAVLDLPQRYTQAKGLVELRNGLAQYYAQSHGVELDPERIIVTNGSSAGFVLSFLGGFAPGARIALTRPGYPAYLNILSGLNLKAVDIPLSPDNGWHLRAADIERAYARTPFEGLLFASPANPTGAAVSATELAEIVQTCARLGVRLISDEIYHGLDHQQRSPSALETTQDAIVINSFSKYHCMTGWRVGWLVLPPELVRKSEILQQNMFISAPTLSQVGAVAALGASQYAEAQKAHYAKNRDLVQQGLNDLGFVGEIGEGAFYAYMDASRHTNDTAVLCKALLEEAGVAMTPGLDFDRVNGHRFVRVSYAGDHDAIAQALERMAGFLK